MRITIGIPAYKATGHICDCLASIATQSIKKDIDVIIASDNPEDDYDFVKERFPDLSIEILSCEENTGAGLARQRALDACKTDWITFIDADDVFFTPFSIETLVKGIQPNVIEVQAPFLQEISDNPQGVRSVPNADPNSAWVFGKLYNVPFLRHNDIKFTELRALEDGCFNWMINMTIEGSQFIRNMLNEPVYLWRIGSEHSITRIGIEEDGIPQYNFDLCQIGATISAIRATKFCRKKNPFNGNIDRFIVEMMVGQYFTYVTCLARKPIFAEQNLFNAKRFYNECYKEIENRIDDKILADLFTIARGQHSEDMIGIIPEISFFDFMDRIRTEEYGGEKELKSIRSKLPDYIIENDKKTGVATF